jgi:glycine betaine/proline transport system ATP-binding protein
MAATGNPRDNPRGGNPSLEARDVWKVYGRERAQHLARLPQPVPEDIKAAGGTVALREASFDVAKGEIFMIMGLSGSGKSTLLRCLTGLQEATRGEIRIAGIDIVTADRQALMELRRRKISMVFQNFALLPHLNALDNVAFPLRVQKIARAERQARAAETLQLVGLGDKLERFPNELSGGQQQRVGIARSLVTDPEIWFLDEPFSALDPLIRRDMQDEFRRLQSQLHKTIVFVTHDLDEAIRLGDRIAIMSDGQILQIGVPEDFVLNPANDYVRDFVKGIQPERVLKVRSIVEPMSEAGAGNTPIAGNLILSQVARRVIEADAPFPVADEAGKVIGQISRRGLAKWLA